MPPVGSSYPLRQLQVGKEVAPGTSVAATERLVGTCEVDADFEQYRSSQPLGVLAENSGPIKNIRKDVGVKIDMPGITYEQLTWILNAAIDVPTTTGAGPFVHTYDPSMAAVADPNSLTVEGRWTDGTNHEDIEIPYVMFRNFSLAVEQNQEMRLSADGFGRDLVDAAVTALSIPTNLESIIAAEGSLFLNDSFAGADADTPGAGQVTKKLISVNLDFKTGLMPFHGIGGDLRFSEHKETTKQWTGTVKMLYDAGAAPSAAAERVKAAANAMRFLTLSFVGSSGRKLRIVLCGTHEKADFIKIGEQDGMDVVEMPFVGHLDATASKLWKFVVTNNEAAAP